MNFRQIFTNQPWWGKLIGAFFGYLAAGPVGAFFGVLLGNMFDKGLMEHFTHSSLHDRLKHQTTSKQIFLETTFAIMGYLAKIDGRVSEKEIKMANHIMNELHLNASQKEEARHHFNLGKQKEFHLHQTLMKLMTTLQYNKPMLKLFIDIQFEAAQVDGLTAPKITALNHILSALGFAPLERQDRFYQQANSGFYQQHQHQSHSSRQAYTPRDPLETAYAVLQVKPDSSKQEVKKAYQRLISRHHPDKLIAKGMPEAQIKLANEKTQTIRKAYESICSAKGW